MKKVPPLSVNGAVVAFFGVNYEQAAYIDLMGQRADE
jgi:hypothetical protein